METRQLTNPSLCKCMYIINHTWCSCQHQQHAAGSTQAAGSDEHTDQDAAGGVPGMSCTSLPLSECDALRKTHASTHHKISVSSREKKAAEGS